MSGLFRKRNKLTSSMRSVTAGRRPDCSFVSGVAGCSNVSGLRPSTRGRNAARPSWAWLLSLLRAAAHTRDANQTCGGTRVPGPFVTGFRCSAPALRFRRAPSRDWSPALRVRTSPDQLGVYCRSATGGVEGDVGNLRVENVSFRNYGIIRRFGTPLDGLTVLVGPNGVGKSSVLRGIEASLAGDNPPTDSVVRFHVDAGDSETLALLWRLDALDATVLADAEAPWFLDADEYDLVRRIVTEMKSLFADVSPDEALEVLKDELVSPGAAADLADRAALVSAVVQGGDLLVNAQVVYGALVPLRATPQVRDAAARLVASSDDDASGDLVVMWAQALGLGYPAAFPMATTNMLDLDTPEVVWLDTSVVRLRHLAVDTLLEAHDRLYSHYEKLHLPDQILVAQNVAFSDWFQVDPWLGSMPASDQTSDHRNRDTADSSGGLGALVELSRQGVHLTFGSLPEYLMRPNVVFDAAALDALSSHSTDDWYRVKPTLVKMASTLSELANELAPSFVRAHGRIDLTVRPPSRWQTDDIGSRIEIGIWEHDGEYRRFEDLSDGLQRWIAATFQLLRGRLKSSVRSLTSDAIDLIQSTRSAPDGAPFAGAIVDVTTDELNLVVDAARMDPAGTDLLALDLGELSPNRVWLVDEPEAHLHPTAVRSVVGWLEKRATESLAVIVATHDTSFLELSNESATVLLGRREDGATSFRKLNPRSLKSLRAASQDLGLSTAQLLGFTRLILFVEGPHDEIVLNEFVGEELESHGVVVVPMHGTRESLTGLADSEVVFALGVQVGVLTDDTYPEQLKSRTGKTGTEKAVVRLIQEAEAAGREIHAFGLRRKDILNYLDDEVCREAAPSFPGWTDAVAAWHSASTSVPIKTWLRNTYDLRLDRKSVRSLAAATKKADMVPKEFGRLMKEILAVASTAPDGDHSTVQRAVSEK